MGVGVLIQITPQMRDPGGDRSHRWTGRASTLWPSSAGRNSHADPFSGCLFIFRSRSGKAIRMLAYDGQGFWLAQKRLSKGRFKWWPTGNGPAKTLRAHQAQLLLAAGDSRMRSRAGVAARERANKKHAVQALRSSFCSGTLHANGCDWRYRGRAVTAEDILLYDS